MGVRINLNCRLRDVKDKRFEKTIKQEQNKFMIHNHLKQGQSTKISKNDKISKGVRNKVRKDTE